jgi:hypothetical protein
LTGTAALIRHLASLDFKLLKKLTRILLLCLSQVASELQIPILADHSDREIK